MNDDLHDIDRLFRDGIEGHEELPPPSVWDGVGHDLDKKQASYYKRKYQRLKRAAWLLLLLLFAGGVYVVYKTSGRKEEPSVQKSPAKKETATSSNRNPSVPFAVNGPAKLKETQEAENTTFSADTGSASSRRNPAEKKETEKSDGGTRISTGLTHTVPAIEPPVGPLALTVAQRLNEKAKTKEQRMKERQSFASASRNRRPGDESLNHSRSVAPQVPQPSFTAGPLPAKDYNRTAISLQAVPANARTILPQTPAASRSKTGTPHGFSLSAFAAPNISFDRLEDNDRLAGPGRDRQEARRQEQDNFSFSAGLLLTYSLTNRWAVQSGLSVTSSTTAIGPKEVYAKTDNSGRTRYELNCSSGYVYIDPKSGVPRSGDTARTSGTVTKLTYVTVPASVSYQISKGRFSLLPSIGIGLNFLTSGKTTTNLSKAAGGSESATASITGLKAAYADGHFGFGIEYNLSKKIAIGVRPNARVALTPINRETPVQSYQNYLSVESGVRIKL